jgi:hypothetical protein
MEMAMLVFHIFKLNIVIGGQTSTYCTVRQRKKVEKMMPWMRWQRNV